MCVCACVCVCVCVWRVPFDESKSSRPFLKFTREWIKAHVAQIEVCSKGQPRVSKSVLHIIGLWVWVPTELQDQIGAGRGKLRW